MEQDWENGINRKTNTIRLWGNDKTMNINEMVLSNIVSSTYYRLDLHKFRTHYELIDEIYYKVEHLEPWEKGSQRNKGQRQSGGVRGVGYGGLASTGYCILYKLFTLKLTRNQLNHMINHTDSCYIRGIGLLYIRYCIQPSEFWDWFKPYLDDDEFIDPKAGGGRPMTIGSMVQFLLTQIDWFNTLFPRIPVPIQKEINEKLLKYNNKNRIKNKYERNRELSRSSEKEYKKNYRKRRSNSR